MEMTATNLGDSGVGSGVTGTRQLAPSEGMATLSASTKFSIVPNAENHDDDYSVRSNYHEASTNDLTCVQGAALLVAEFMGTGILALPATIHSMGTFPGLAFMVLNLPINYYAGVILAQTATIVEARQRVENLTSAGAIEIDVDGDCDCDCDCDQSDNDHANHNHERLNQNGKQPSTCNTAHIDVDSITRLGIDMDPENENGDVGSLNDTGTANPVAPKNAKGADAFEDEPETSVEIAGSLNLDDIREANLSSVQPCSPDNDGNDVGGTDSEPNQHAATNNPLHHDTATFDFIGMSSALFHNNSATQWVMLLFYVNVFLVMGDYILVMSHAVAAMIGEDRICIPTAGLVASTLMLGASQLKTMASLGRSVSLLSLAALFVVVGQCVYALRYQAGELDSQNMRDQNDESDTATSITEAFFRKSSALGGVGFAVGSQKLFLNVRHEMRDRKEAPRSLALALGSMCITYIGAVLAAGDNPPGFLFDVIPRGLNRKVAGFLLWIHVVVSYAINSQAICASMDRLFLSKMKLFESATDRRRWLILTSGMVASTFLVANAIPFFKDLVSFTGALTSVPLALLLPAIFHRKILRVPIWSPTWATMQSYSLLAFAVVFMVVAVSSSVYTIAMDWEEHQGGFFSCHS